MSFRRRDDEAGDEEEEEDKDQKRGRGRILEVGIIILHFILFSLLSAFSFHLFV